MMDMRRGTQGIGGGIPGGRKQRAGGCRCRRARVAVGQPRELSAVLTAPCPVLSAVLTAPCQELSAVLTAP